MPVPSQSAGSQRSDTSFDYVRQCCEGETSFIADGVCDYSVNTVACDFDEKGLAANAPVVADVPCNRIEAVFDCQDPDATADCSLTATSQVDPTSLFGYSR